MTGIADAIESAQEAQAARHLRAVGWRVGRCRVCDHRSLEGRAHPLCRKALEDD